MRRTDIEPQRIDALNDVMQCDGDYVLYWMQQSQRAKWNPALEFAVQRANELGKRLLVGFGLMDDYPEANVRHYRFMLEGLGDVAANLEQRGIHFVLQRGHPAEVALHLGKDAATIVCDRGYLRHQKVWRDTVADDARCPVFQVESDVVVPVDEASDKREYAARTIRPKINRQRDQYIREFRGTPLKKDSLNLSVEGEDLSDIDALLARMKCDASVPAVDSLFTGGENEAKRVWDRFIDQRFSDYESHRNKPETDDVSYMSLYLHFGHISPVFLAWSVQQVGDERNPNVKSYLEEMIVRRELAMNFVNFHPKYDDYSCLPAWAQKTLREHAKDKRNPSYTFEQLENAETHDDYWNAAMREMRYTGYMHNYMRMYWGKKILEWSASPQEAYKATLALNNRYFIDGRDGNSYANVGWIFGLHDRPWFERPIFGKVRYMAATGLERKCDIKGYVTKVDELVAKAEN